MNTPSIASVLLELAADFEARGETTRQPSPLGTVLTSEGAAWCSAANLLRRADLVLRRAHLHVSPRGRRARARRAAIRRGPLPAEGGMSAPIYSVAWRVGSDVEAYELSTGGGEPAWEWELVVECDEQWTSVLALVWLESDDQPWRWSIVEASWLDRDDAPSGEAATLHDAQQAAAACVRGELATIVELLAAPAGMAVPS